jgi:hypothetical protein
MSLFRQVIQPEINSDGKAVLAAIVPAHFMTYIRFEKNKISGPGNYFNLIIFITSGIVINDQISRVLRNINIIYC